MRRLLLLIVKRGLSEDGHVEVDTLAFALASIPLLFLFWARRSSARHYGIALVWSGCLA